MVSTYHGIETGRRANEFFKKSMEISGTNLGNMSKEGYSRQVVSAQAAPGLVSAVNVSYLGTGVEITAIERMRDMYLDAQYRRASVDQAFWETTANGVTRVGTIIVNTNELGLNNLLDSFWAALQEVSKRPEEGYASIANAFLQEADTLAKFTGDLYSSYAAYREELNRDIESMVEDANSYIDRIAILNEGIRKVRQAGGEPNALLDERDLLADKLIRLTGAEVGTSKDEMDGDYKIFLNGRIIVQGASARHLMLVGNQANDGYYDVQVEYNQYDVTSNPEVAGAIVEQGAKDAGVCSLGGTHTLEVIRTADELFWTVGLGQERVQPALPTDPVGIEGSFALQVGSNGARIYSQAFNADGTTGRVLGTPGAGEPEKYQFRIAAGDFESTITLEWGGTDWQISDNLGNPPMAGTAGVLTVSDLKSFIDNNYDGNISAKEENGALILEGEFADQSSSGHLISVTDMIGSLAASNGLANENPIVLIEVSQTDTLQEIANKINNAYKFDTSKTKEDGTPLYTTVPPDTAPSSPDQWLHASVEIDANGAYYLCLTSNTAGEAARINVLPGSVCGSGSGEMMAAQRLGLVEDATSYIQIDRESGTVTTRTDGDVFVDDAYFIVDGKRFLSVSNAFKEARYVPDKGIAEAEALQDAITGVRLFLNGAGGNLSPGSNVTTISAKHHLSGGEIMATLSLRDDTLLSQMDTFDDIMYKLASEFNASHYAGYGTDGYSGITGMKFFGVITSKYGAFGKLSLDEDVFFNPGRVAVSTGDGNGHTTGDGMNAIALAQLKQAKLFMGGTADFNNLYRDFEANLGALGARAISSLTTQDYIIEQVDAKRQSVMGVNSSEEMLSLVEHNNQFNKSSQYISTLFQVIDKIINGVGRVGL
ncbi:MAG: flagellar hook-associated protein FlgK [Synergistaceae bacterium]|jgi:flagellar hook-associated protein 1 FlgK|nr:flagellar hook-associated protein FlgK [Synergistaceae bacterium]